MAYTVTLSATNPAKRGAAKRVAGVLVPEQPWVVSAYGRPTPANLSRFVATWERSVRRHAPLRVTRAIIVRRGKAPGVVATYTPAA